MSHAVLVSLFAIALLPGLVGIVIPVLPGMLYMLIVTGIFAATDHFQHIGKGEFAILAGLTLLSFIIDHLSGVIGAKIGGASKRALQLGFIGMAVGFFIFPPLGSLLGLFLGVLGGELFQRRGQKLALRAASGSVAGAVSGTLLNLGIGLLFILLFIVFSWR